MASDTETRDVGSAGLRAEFPRPISKAAHRRGILPVGQSAPTRDERLGETQPIASSWRHNRFGCCPEFPDPSRILAANRAGGRHETAPQSWSCGPEQDRPGWWSVETAA